MNIALQTFFAASLGWLAVVIAASVVGMFMYAPFRKLGMLASPHRRSAALLVYATLPVMVASIVSIALYFPQLAVLLLPEHCHADTCTPHAPEFAASAAYAGMITVTALTALVLVFYVPVQQLIRHIRKSQIVKRLSRPAAEPGFHIVENDAAIAWCDGLLSPEIFISQGFLARVDKTELSIVLAHERAHAQRRDNLVRLVIDWGTRLWPEEIRRAIRSDFNAAAEQACDQAAATDNVDTATVAAVISKLSGIGSAEKNSSSSFTTDAEQRIVALSADTTAANTARFAQGLMLLLLCLTEIFVFTQMTHPLLEWLSR